MIFAWSESEFDQSAGIWNGLVLPSIVGLITPHRRFALGIPCPRWLSAQIVLANERFLDFLCALGIDLLLASKFT